MKEKIEKIRIGKPNEPKIWPTIDQVKHENSSKFKISIKKAKTKNFPLQQDPEGLKLNRTRPKSKSSTILETIDLSVNNNKAVENLEIDDITESKKKKSSNKKVLKNIKKNKSLDHVGKLRIKNHSSTTSNTLQPKNFSPNPKYLDLLRTNKKSLNERDPLFPNVLDNYSTKFNFFNYNHFTKLQNVTNEQMTAGKSMSYDSLRVFNRSKQLSKCFSEENNKNMISEKPTGVFVIHKNNTIRIPEDFTSNLTTRSFNKENSFNQPKKPSEKTFTSGPKEICRIPNQIYKTNSTETSSGSEIPYYQNYKNNQNEEPKKNCFGIESFIKNTGPCLETFDSARNYSVQDFTSEKKEVKICQCLHFHTEDGIKKLTLQNNTNEKEFGHKFFRVNYFSNKEDETSEQMASKVQLVDKGTITAEKLVTIKSEELEQHKCSVSKRKTNQKTTLNKMILTKLKTISKNSLKDSKKKKGKEKKKDNRSNGKFILWRTQNQMRIIDQSKLTKKKEINPEKGDAESKKMKRQTETKLRRKTEKSLKKLEEISKEKAVAQRILEELEVLEKLFIKLNSTEISLIRRKTPLSVETDKEDLEYKKLLRLMSKKEKTSLKSSKEKASLILTETEAEEKYRRLRNKLRNAIIRHVQNFFNLDFTNK